MIPLRKHIQTATKLLVKVKVVIGTLNAKQLDFEVIKKEGMRKKEYKREKIAFYGFKLCYNYAHSFDPILYT